MVQNFDNFVLICHIVNYKTDLIHKNDKFTTKNIVKKTSKRFN